METTAGRQAKRSKRVFKQGRCRLSSSPHVKFLTSFHPFPFYPDRFGGHTTLFFHINRNPAENFKMSGKINDVLPTARVHIQFLRVTTV